MNAPDKILYWTPRVLCILAILFISLFAMDAFDPKLSGWQQLGAFLGHLIPSFILLALLIIAWKWELVGGIAFLLIGLGFSPFVFIRNYQMNDSVWLSIAIIMMITIPFAIVGTLFIFGHFNKQAHKKKLK